MDKTATMEMLKSNKTGNNHSKTTSTGETIEAETSSPVFEVAAEANTPTKQEGNLPNNNPKPAIVVPMDPTSGFHARKNNSESPF